MKGSFITLVFLAGMACQHKEILTEQALKEYVLDPDNGLFKQKESHGVNIAVFYRPSALVTAQQLDGMIDKESRARTIKTLDSLTYFVIKFSRNGQEIENAFASDEPKFLNVINYLSSSIGRDIYLLNKGDTINALDAVYAPMFGAASATSVMAVFKTDLRQRSGSVKFCVDDTKLGVGKNEFEFDLKNIRNTPTLNLN